MNDKDKNKSGLLHEIDAYVHTERIQKSEKMHQSDGNAIIRANLKAANSSKQILSKLYIPVVTSGSKLKKWVITKISNIVKNTVERPLTTQQKYNQQVYTVISKLEERITELEKKHEE